MALHLFSMSQVAIHDGYQACFKCIRCRKETVACNRVHLNLEEEPLASIRQVLMAVLELKKN